MMPCQVTIFFMSWHLLHIVPLLGSLHTWQYMSFILLVYLSLMLGSASSSHATMFCFTFLLSFSSSVSASLASLRNAPTEHGHGAYSIFHPCASVYLLMSVLLQKYNGLTRGTNCTSCVMPVFGPRLQNSSGFPFRRFIMMFSASSSRLWPVTSLSAPSSLAFLLSIHRRTTPHMVQFPMRALVWIPDLK